MSADTVFIVKVEESVQDSSKQKMFKNYHNTSYKCSVYIIYKQRTRFLQKKLLTKITCYKPAARC